jgi:hypothetical protein
MAVKKFLEREDVILTKEKSELANSTVHLPNVMIVL